MVAGRRARGRTGRGRTGRGRARDTTVDTAEVADPSPDTPITSLLELRLRPERLPGAMAALDEALVATRAREGCLGVDVMVDTADAAHVVVVERWASSAHDDAYRAWRATPDGASALGEVLAGPPALTRLAPAGPVS